ncbi:MULTISPECIES: ABC transporter ATP-binding protein [Bacillus]|uniref:Carnitine transport ATP-binding protein OpuCA n=2 Tax=Bacillus TaxID=1386 RepID=A0A0M4FNQ6_9BACI|nr:MULTISPECIES: ABC transporter ATP-binding protein [Bacillus]ALC80284.1 transporter [Bacillus gobiensis]MBP1083883.1 iron(III) transport system ATP-binding protein [Bacillus capparidis]MED1098364.1 ABC transporter ATP-binding protein [Bacillus capparidis]
MIELNGVSKQYGSFSALNHINLSFKEGEFIAILGPSGCGKTTLLRLLAGFIKPSEGSIFLNEEEIASPKRLVKPEKRNIGMVFQSFALWPHLTVQEHVEFALKHHRFTKNQSKQQQEERVHDVLKMVEMEAFKHRYPSELSGGQRQRVALARAIVPEPVLLLMDEPLSALDAELRMEMRKEIQSIHQQTKATIVYVTHDQSEALAMADRIIVMNNGIVEQADTPEVIYTKPETVFVSTFVGKSNLIQGQWTKQNVFIPDGFPMVEWEDIGISQELKNQNLFPVRPEQWKIGDPTENSIVGVVSFVQFQGNEIHYNVKIEKQMLTLYSPAFQERYQPGDIVGLTLAVEKKKGDNKTNDRFAHSFRVL